VARETHAQTFRSRSGDRVLKTGKASASLDDCEEAAGR